MQQQIWISFNRKNAVSAFLFDGQLTEIANQREQLVNSCRWCMCGHVFDGWFWFCFVDLYVTRLSFFVAVHFHSFSRFVSRLRRIPNWKPVAVAAFSCNKFLLTSARAVSSINIFYILPTKKHHRNEMIVNLNAGRPHSPDLCKARGMTQWITYGMAICLCFSLVIVVFQVCQNTEWELDDPLSLSS